MVGMRLRYCIIGANYIVLYILVVVLANCVDYEVPGSKVKLPNRKDIDKIGKRGCFVI